MLKYVEHALKLLEASDNTIEGTDKRSEVPFPSIREFAIEPFGTSLNIV